MTTDSKLMDIEAAHRWSATLAAAMPRHACHCGTFGSTRFEKGGPWFCGDHVERDAARVPVRGIGQAAESGHQQKGAA